MSTIQGPSLTVDIIISANQDDKSGIVLIKRKNRPFGWALPGGFVDHGERVLDAAIREAREETKLEIVAPTLFGVYSDPARDPRGHTVSVVFTAVGRGILTAADDAREAACFAQDELPEKLAFDHAQIIADYHTSLQSEQPPFVR